LFVIGIGAPFGQPFTIAGGMALIAAAISDHGRNPRRFRDVVPPSPGSTDTNTPLVSPPGNLKSRHHHFDRQSPYFQGDSCRYGCGRLSPACGHA
jgi:hypothetical protein